MNSVANWINSGLAAIFSTIIIFLSVKILNKYRELNDVYKESRLQISADLSDILKIKNEYKELAEALQKRMGQIADRIVPLCSELGSSDPVSLEEENDKLRREIKILKEWLDMYTPGRRVPEDL